MKFVSIRYTSDQEEFKHVQDCAENDEIERFQPFCSDVDT